MSFHRIPAVTDNDLDPEEPALGLQVGESRTEGTVSVLRAIDEVYVAECAACGWRKSYTSVNAVNWHTFTHNTARRKHGCPPNPTREDV